MGETTTFASLITQPVSEKVYLATLYPAQELNIWTLTAAQTYTYEKSFLNESITLADGGTENIRKVLSKVTEDGTALTERASIALVEANAGSWWHDTANSLVYIHPTGSDDPVSHTVVGFFPLRLATKAITLGGNFYEPLISEKGIPALRHKSKDIYWGSEVITAGDIQLINSSGFFDQIFRSFIWSGKEAVLKLGGDALAYAEYQTIFTGTIQGKRYTRNEINFSLKAKAFNLFQAIPLNKYLTADFPNLDPAAEGKVIPYFYGVYSAAQAPEATCIDSAYSVNETQWKICDGAPGAIKSITQVYINYDGGGGWQAIAHSNESLANATFTIETAFVPGATRVKVAFEAYYSGAAVIEGAPEIVEHLLTSVLPYVAGDLNAASFTASKTESEVVLNVPIETETTAMAVIDKICATDIAFFDEDSDGKFRYRTWTVSRGSGLDNIVDSDFIETPEIEDDLEHLYWKVFIGYGYLCTDKKYLYHEETSNDSDYKFERKETFSEDTYLRGSSDAQILAQRLLFLMGSPGPQLRGRTKLQLAGKLLGDQIAITLARAPFSAGGYVKRVFEIFGLDKSCFPAFIDFEARDVQDFGSNAGMWAGAAAPAWATATDAEKAVSGFWADANGFVDPADPETKNISRWW